MPVPEANVLARHLLPLSFKSASYDPLLKAIGDAQIVLIGDGSHGTYEFYAHRANITHRLIEEKGFTAVAVEADWPDAIRINRYIHGGCLKNGDIKTPFSALRDFERFPKWMWKNEVMPPFIQYLRDFNDSVMRSTGDPAKKVSFFGLDLYSLHRSAAEVLKYLETVDPEGARRARKQYNCFERFGEDTARYAYEAQFGLSKMCSQEVLRVLQDLLHNHYRYVEEQLDGPEHSHPSDEQFMAEMNALVVRDAEEYYRTMMTEDAISWNLRDDHFARVLVHIARHFGTSTDGEPKPAKIVVWAHNSHIGDARATDMGKRRGEVNLGQRCRQLFGDENVFNVGFLTDRGTVTAAYSWDEDAELMSMAAPMRGSLEELLDVTADRDSLVVARRIEKDAEGNQKKVDESYDLTEFLNRPRYQRFIGVIYRRSTELQSHYSICNAVDQYDALAIVKNSRGIRPLEKEDHLKSPLGGDYDETFPFGY